MLGGGLGTGVTVYPGGNEMLALAKGVLRVLSGKEMEREICSASSYPRRGKTSPRLVKPTTYRKHR